MTEMNKEAPTADDNLLTRHKHIAESIEMIRLKKDQLLRTLRGLSENENPDRELMTKLIEAFDTMTAQENSFLAVLKNIVEIHEQATSDLAEENDELRKNQETSNGKQNDVNTNDTQESKQKGEDDDDDEKLIKETLKELEQVSIQALAAAELNEKLVETLQRHKKNRVSMLELRKDKTEKLKMAANAAIVEVKKAKKEVSINRAELQKKQREAEDLRKAALKAGIQIGAEEQKHSDEVTAALNAQVNNVDRIPPIPVIEKSPEDSKDAKEEDPLEARRKQIRENVRKEKERREHVNQTIREKLLAMEARKQRMKEIRRLLSKNQADASTILNETRKKLETVSSQDDSFKSTETGSQENSADYSDATQVCSEPIPHVSFDIETENDDETRKQNAQTRMDIEKTFRSAELNLQNLTALRERLEEMQIRGENLSEDDVHLISQLDKENSNSDEQNDDDDIHVKINDYSQFPDDENDENNDEMRTKTVLTNTDQLRNIEQILHHHTSILTELLRLNQPSNSRDVANAAVAVHPVVLLDILESTSSSLLRILSSFLLQLADGHQISGQLLRILVVICERYIAQHHETFPQGNLTTDQIDEQQRRDVEKGIADDDDDDDEDEDDDDDDDEPLAESTNIISQSDLEQTITNTMITVNSILDECTKLDNETLERLRNVVVTNVASLFTNVPRSMIDAQLGGLICDVVITFMDQWSVVDDVAHALSDDIVRILNTELDFYHLINSLNHIPDP